MKFLRRLLLLCALTPGLASAGHGAPLAVPPAFAPPPKLDLTILGTEIKTAVTACKWQVSFERRGYVEALIQKKSLMIRAGLLYDPTQVRMVYLENSGFHYQIDEDGTVIVHKNLNIWLSRLDSCVRASVNGSAAPMSPEPDSSIPAESKDSQ